MEANTEIKSKIQIDYFSPELSFKTDVPFTNRNSESSISAL